MYTTIIHPLRKALCLSIQEYVLLDTVYHLSNNQKYGHWCIMSKKKLADVLDVNPDTIYRILKTLEAKGLIERDDVTGYIRTLDSFNEMIANKHDWLIGFKGKESALLSGKFNLDSENPRGSRKVRQGVSENPSPTSRKIRDNNTNINNNKNNLLSVSFEKFWKAYPKRKNKASAFKAFQKVKVPLEDLLKAVEVQKNSEEWKKQGGQFIPYPASWLNGGAWEDEADIAVEAAENDLIAYYKSVNCNDAMFIKKHGIDALSKIINKIL